MTKKVSPFLADNFIPWCPALRGVKYGIGMGGRGGEVMCSHAPLGFFPNAAVDFEDELVVVFAGFVGCWEGAVPEVD